MIDTFQTLLVPQRNADIEEFYKEAEKRRVTVGNIRETKCGVFVQFTPRVGKRNGKHRTFKNLKAFKCFLKMESALQNGVFLLKHNDKRIKQ